MALDSNVAHVSVPFITAQGGRQACHLVERGQRTLGIDTMEIDHLAEELSRLGREIGQPVDLRRNESKYVRITVVGEFSTGKSTLVNAILGEDLLPTRVTPTTSVITEIVYGPDFTVEARYLDGTTEVLPSPSRVPTRGPATAQYVVPASTSTRNPVAWLKDLMNDESWVTRMEQVRITHPAMPEGLAIVDTPGTNDISQSRLEVLYRYLPESDIIWMVMSARSVLKASEISFLKDKLLGADLARVRFIVNQMDTLDETEAEEIKDYVATSLPPIIKQVATDYGRFGSIVVRDFLMEVAKAPPVVFVSALELCREWQVPAGSMGPLHSETPSLQNPRTIGKASQHALQALLAEALEERAQLAASRMFSFLSRMNAAVESLSSAVSRRASIVLEEGSEIENRLRAEARALDQMLIKARHLHSRFRKEVGRIKNRKFAELSAVIEEGKARVLSGKLTEEPQVQALETELRRKLEALAEGAMKEIRDASHIIAPSVSSGTTAWPGLRLLVTAEEGPQAIDWDAYFGRPTTYFLALVSTMLFGPLGLIAVCGFPLIRSFFQKGKDELELRKAVSDEFRRVEAAAKSLLSQAIDAQAAAVESSTLSELDECQDHICELIDMRASKIEPSDLERWQSELSALSAAIKQRLSETKGLLKYRNREHLEGIIS